MNWGHWRPGAGLDVPWSEGGRVLIWEGVGMEGNTEGVSRFLLLMNLPGPRIGGLHTYTLCIQESDL